MTGTFRGNAGNGRTGKNGAASQPGGIVDEIKFQRNAFGIDTGCSIGIHHSFIYGVFGRRGNMRLLIERNRSDENRLGIRERSIRSDNGKKGIGLSFRRRPGQRVPVSLNICRQYRKGQRY